MADEIFLTGTAAEIVPVTNVDGIQVSAGGGPITKDHEMYTKIVSAEVDEDLGWFCTGRSLKQSSG